MQPFWFENPSILIKTSLEFIPKSNQDEPARLNAVVKFSILVALLLYLYTRTLFLLALPVITLIGTFIKYYYFPDIKRTSVSSEKFSNCQHPSPQNPMMNTLVLDDPNRLPACDSTDPIISKEIDKVFWNNNFRDTTDIYNINGGLPQRFVTNPDTTVSHESYERWKNWVYTGDPKGSRIPSCKDNNYDCKIFEDLRYVSRH